MNRKLLFVSSAFLLLASCQNELPIDLAQPEIPPIAEQQEEFVPNEGMIQLGKKLENPYSLENMRRAFDLLPAESRGGFSAGDIQPTHLYVKFKPKNVDELDAMLWSDSALDFYSHPLDYEVVSGGSYYHDPSLPEDVPTYYYVSIPVGHPIPEVCEYEILEELYIPDELTDYTRTLSPAFINAIVKKSFENFCSTYNNTEIRSSWFWSSTSNSDYSSLFMDLYDNYNQRAIWGDNSYPEDIITGYTPSTLNSIVDASTTLSEIRTQLKTNKPTGVTDAMIDGLIDFFEAYKPE